jgi:integrase
LREREGQIAKGARPVTTRGTWLQASADLITFYNAYRSRDPVEAGYRLAHLDRYFRATRLADLDGSMITRYVVRRQAQGAANGTIGIELATLRKALRLAHENGKLASVPVIRAPKPAAPRSGFFEDEAFEAVCQELPSDLQVAARIAFVFGWRIKSEVLPLTTRQVDLPAGMLRLEPGTTKNDDGRVVYLTPELRSLLRDQIERVRALERELGRIISWVFPHLRGKHKGYPWKTVDKPWRRACRRAGYLGMRPHDLRRTAVRNMVNQGVSERVAMQLTGHKTRTIFDSYHIVSPGDLQDASLRLSRTKPLQNQTQHGDAL